MPTDVVTHGADAAYAQWGGFAFVLIMCMIAIAKLFSVVIAQRDAEKKVEKDHSDLIQKLQRDHAENIQSLSEKRIAQAQSVTAQLMDLQKQFNEGTSGMVQQMRERVLAEDQILTIMSSFDRRLEAIEKKLTEMRR
jgi:virulence-associated protein VapD